MLVHSVEALVGSISRRSAVWMEERRGCIGLHSVQRLGKPLTVVSLPSVEKLSQREVGGKLADKPVRSRPTNGPNMSPWNTTVEIKIGRAAKDVPPKKEKKRISNGLY